MSRKTSPNLPFLEHTLEKCLAHIFFVSVPSLKCIFKQKRQNFHRRQLYCFKRYSSSFTNPIRGTMLHIISKSNQPIWASEAGGQCPLDFEILANKGCFISFEWEKTNFTTFDPLEKFWKYPLVLPLEKSFRRPCNQSMLLFHRRVCNIIR